jgi:hypothetical protein
LVVLTTPRDADPLDMDEEFASQYAQEMGDLPELKKAQFSVTDSGYVLARDLKFALAGGTLVKTSRKKMPEKFIQQQLLHFGPDRIVSIQFSAVESEFAGFAADVAKIFASYQNLGVQRLDDDEP